MRPNFQRVFEQDRFQEIFEKGCLNLEAGQFAEAKNQFKSILRSKPNHSVTLGNLAICLRREGQSLVAKQMLERAVRASAINFHALSTLGNLCLDLKQFDEARQYIAMALKVAPEDPNANTNWGMLLMHDGELEKAKAAFERALELDPGHVHARTKLAICTRELAGTTEYVPEIDELTALVEKEPDNPTAVAMLAHALGRDGRFSRGLVHAFHANKLKETGDSLAMLASYLCIMGEFEDSIPLYERSLELSPHQVNNLKSYLFMSNYSNLIDGEGLYNLYRKIVDNIIEKRTNYTHRGHKKIAGRKIKIGYSSGDFRSHAVYFFVKEIFKSHDRSKFELFAYSNAQKEDEISEKLKQSFDHWIDVSKMSDEVMAQCIFDEGIDVLIDLAGHTNLDRLSVFAMRPAPVQISYLGYGYTTGLKEIDYFITDDNLTPAGSEPFFSETLLRVPAPAYSYQPPEKAYIDVAPLPALKNGYITFGTMSRLIRMNNDVLAVWREILERVPNSRLRFDSRQLMDVETRELFRVRLMKAGIPAECIELGVTETHWEGYHSLDISLDCWPHNMGTTILDSLWMGVPVVSKTDRPSMGRFGAAFMRPVGLGEYVVDDIPSYIEKAVALASDIPALAALRASLRGRMLASPFLQERLMSEKLETVYLEAMQKFEQGNRS